MNGLGFGAWRVQMFPEVLYCLLFMLVYYDGDFESCRAQSAEYRVEEGLFLFSTCWWR